MTYINLKAGLGTLINVLVVILIISLSLFGQSSNDYYALVSNQIGDSLKSALHDIIKDHKEFPYTSTSTDVWDILKVADRDPDDSTMVIGIYSGFSMDAEVEYNKGNGWNRENVWAWGYANYYATKLIS